MRSSTNWCTVSWSSRCSSVSSKFTRRSLWIRRSGQVLEREPEPGACMRAPHRLPVRAWVETEDVQHARSCQLAVEPLVLGAEATVAPADVEGEERRPASEVTTQLRDEGVRALRRRV